MGFRWKITYGQVPNWTPGQGSAAQPRCNVRMATMCDESHPPSTTVSQSAEMVTWRSDLRLPVKSIQTLGG